MAKSFNKTLIARAFQRLDELAPKPFEMIVGGGAAMISAYGCPLATKDIDAVLKGADLEQLKGPVHQTARELELPLDWLNSWFASFTYALPKDFERRLRLIFEGKNIAARALGPEDMLILKCCAHRAKDIGHAKILIRQKANHRFVRRRLERLIEKQLIPGGEDAVLFLEDILEGENAR